MRVLQPRQPAVDHAGAAGRVATRQPPARRAAGLSRTRVLWHASRIGPAHDEHRRYIKVIGRGSDGARPLDRGQAHDLMSQVLDGRVTDLEIGAFALAMRIKGESVAELAGFLAPCTSAASRCASTRPTVVLPSYNGSRKVPTSPPCWRCCWRSDDVAVLVHGPAHDPGRVATPRNLPRPRALTCAEDGEDIEAAWQRREPAFIRTDALCPPLARLLEVRRGGRPAQLGPHASRSCSAAAAAPDAARRQLHPSRYGAAAGQFLAATGADAMLMRGTEGEPVADARRQQRLDVYLRRPAADRLSRPAQEGVLTGLPVLPAARRDDDRASRIQAIVSGAMPAPLPIAGQTTACCARSRRSRQARRQRPRRRPRRNNPGPATGRPLPGRLHRP